MTVWTHPPDITGAKIIQYKKVRDIQIHDGS